MKVKLKLSDKYPFGKWKGEKIERMIPKDDDNFECFSLFGRGDGLSYLQWVKETCKNIELSKDILMRMDKIEKARALNRWIHRKPALSSFRHKRANYQSENYNDMGWMVDVGFDEVYGTFGY